MRARYVFACVLANHCDFVLTPTNRHYYTTTQDTFSFALVLLCLAVGDIAFVRKQGGIIARTAYFSGWRPKLRKSLRTECPEIATLIEEMWLADFRARPAMKDVVVRLEACVSVEDASNDSETSTPDESVMKEAAPPSSEQINILEATVRDLQLVYVALKEEIMAL